MYCQQRLRHSLRTPKALPDIGLFGALLAFWEQGQSVGNLSDAYTEYSGLTFAQKSANVNYLWAINDGATGYIIAINRSTAALAGEWTLSGIATSDVEDVASATVGGQPYIYVADTGDNANARATFRIYRVKEPTITGGNGVVAAGDIELITCEFPAGNLPAHKDVECLLVDPDTGDMYVITKRISPIKCYKLAHAASYVGTQTLVFVGDLSNDAELNTISSIQSGNNGYVAAGCVSPDGKEIVLKNYNKIFHFPRNKATQTIIQALQVAPAVVDAYVGGGIRTFHPYLEPQGESLCFDREGVNLYTCSEFISNQGSAGTAYPLFRYRRLGSVPTKATFQNGASGYTGCVDTYLDSGAPAVSNAASVTMVADFDYSAFPTISRTRQCLIKWDISTIPTSKIVVGAWIDFYINTEGLGFELFKMLQSWVDTDTWNSTGGILTNDIEAASAYSTKIGVPSGSHLDTYVGFVRLNLPLSLVQAWVNTPATNYGLLIRAQSEATGDGVQLDTSESATQARKPKLTVIYT